MEAKAPLSMQDEGARQGLPLVFVPVGSRVAVSCAPIAQSSCCDRWRVSACHIVSHGCSA